jgi:hypothetical protein
VPNFYYGISDQLSVGLAHNPGAEIFQTQGRGLCLTGDTGGCAKVYNNLSLDSLFSFSRSSTMDIAFHGGLDFISLSDPTALSLRLGVKGKTMVGPMILVFDPSISIGLTERDINKESISLPVRLGFMATPAAQSRPVDRAVRPAQPADWRLRRLLLRSARRRRHVRSQQHAGRARAVHAGPPDRRSNGGADARTLSVGAAWRM